MGRFDLHQYTNSDNTSHPLPWQSPDYEFSISTSYNMQNKILVNAEFIYFERMYALSYNNNFIETQEIRNRPDFNLGLEYRYTKLLGIFLKMNNLASLRYYSWNNYPVQKFNILGGLSFSF